MDKLLMFADKERAAEAAARAQKKSERTQEKRKADFIELAVESALEDADEGPTYTVATYMEPAGYTAYGERVMEEATEKADSAWDKAVRIWNETPCNDEDGDEKYDAVVAAFGGDDTLAEEIRIMEMEIGKVEQNG